MRKLQPYRIHENQKVVVRAESLQDAVYGTRKQLTFDASNIVMQTEAGDRRVPGTVGVSGFGVPAVYRGDHVVVSGKLQSARGSRLARMSFTKIEVTAHHQTWQAALSRKFAARLQSVLPEPHGSLVLGLMVGQRTTLPEGLNNDLSTVGLTHIVAVSGYNLTILVDIARRLLERFSKYQATAATFVLIFGFVLLCGASASLVRAALVSGLSLIAWYYGRTVKPWLVILLAAAITAGWFPPYVWSDIGWYLSFLAFVGILLVAPVVTARFAFTQKLGPAGQLLVETSSAQLMTTPLILYIFGKLSLIALVSNLLVLPFIPFTMLAGLVAGLSGWIVPSFAGWLAWPAWQLSSYILSMVHLTAQVPAAALDMQFSLVHMTICYIVLLGLVLVWKNTCKTAKIQIRNSRSL